MLCGGNCEGDFFIQEGHWSRATEYVYMKNQKVYFKLEKYLETSLVKEFGIGRENTNGGEFRSLLEKWMKV